MKPMPNQQKIIKVSRAIRYALFAGVVLWAVSIPVVLLHVFLSTPVVAGIERLSLQGSFILMMVFQLIATFQLFRFFDRLQRGHLFDATTVRHLKTAGQWCIVLWLFEVFHATIRQHALADATGWVWNPSTLILGLVLTFFAWLLREAQGLQEEQELTV